jgi:hypothetical protein
MRTTLSVLTLAVLAGAHAQPLVFVDYDNQLQSLNPPTVGARFWHSVVSTGASGQNRNVGRFDAATNAFVTGTGVSRVADPAMFNTETGQFVVGNTYQLRFAFIGEGTGTNRGLAQSTILRLFSAATTPPTMVNPVLDTTQPVRFDIWSRAPIRVALLVSEAAQTAPVGGRGSGALPFEVIGGPEGTPDALDPASATDVRAFGGYVVPAGRWVTLTVNMSDPALYTIRNFVGGNAVLNPATPERVGLNSLLFSPVDGEGGTQVEHMIFLDFWRTGFERPGDINVDGLVDLQDFLMLASVYDTASTDPAYDQRADLDDDGRVDLADFLILAANYDP